MTSAGLNVRDLIDHDKPLLAADLDSLDFASVLMALEDEFKVSFADVDLETVASINKLVAYIDARKVDIIPCKQILWAARPTCW